MTDEGIHHALQDLVPVVVIVTMTIASVWVIKLLVGAFRNRSVLRAQTEHHNKILEKFGTAEEFTKYLQSDAGKAFFDNLSKEPSSSLTKILSAIQKGAILTLLGIGFFLFNAVADLSVDGKVVSLFVAVLCLTSGIGFLVSSGISYRLAKSWGLFSNDPKPPAIVPSNTAP